MTAGRPGSGRNSTSMLLRRSECSCSCRVRSTRLFTSSDFLCGDAGRENSRRFWTMRAARRACLCVSSSWRLVGSSVPSRSRSSSVTPRMAVRGLFNSWATPASICPMAASFSAWMSCSSRRLRSVTSRPERTTPSFSPLASQSGLKLKRIRRHSPSLADASFQGCERLAASYDVAEQRLDGGHVFGMSAMPKIHGGDFLGLEAENLFRTRADERIVSAGIEHQNEIREAVHQAAGKFLLLVKAALHFAAFGDVHNRALITNNMAGVIAYGGGGVQANDGRAVLADESDFAALEHGLKLDLLL